MPMRNNRNLRLDLVGKGRLRRRGRIEKTRRFEVLQVEHEQAIGGRYPFGTCSGMALSVQFRERDSRLDGLVKTAVRGGLRTAAKKASEIQWAPCATKDGVAGRGKFALQNRRPNPMCPGAERQGREGFAERQRRTPAGGRSLRRRKLRSGKRRL